MTHQLPTLTISPIDPSPDTQHLFDRAAAIYGVEAQTLKLVEELSELSAALMREHLGVGQPGNAIPGELADVLILIAQLMRNKPDIERHVHDRITAKLERLDERVMYREKQMQAAIQFNHEEP